MQAVLLAAGRGVRLRPHTDTTPKSMLPLAGKPLLEHIIASLPGAIDELLIAIGYRGEQVRDYFGDHFGGLPVRYGFQDPINGTGTALHLFKEQLRGEFLVVNGDDLYAPEDLKALGQGGPACLVFAEQQAVPSAVIEDRNHSLVGLEEKGFPKKENLRICGAYLLNQKFFRQPLAKIEVRGGTEYSLPHTLVSMAKETPIRVQRASWWYPVGTPEQYRYAQELYYSRPAA